MGPYLFGLVIFGVIWTILTVGAIGAWREETGQIAKAKAAKRMLWFLVGFILIPVYPMAIAGAILLGLVALIRAAFRDIKNGASS